MILLVVLLSVIVLVIGYAFYEKEMVMARVYGSDKRKARIIVVVGALVLSIVWGWFYFWKVSPQRDIEAKAKDCGNTTMAFVMSQNYVRQRLKSPGSAEFPYVNSRGVNVLADGKCGFVVSAYVDSQNGFGAKIRSSYQAVISYDRQSKLWKLGAININ